MQNPEVIVFNYKKRLSGVSTSILSLQPILEEKNPNLYFFGYALESTKFRKISFFKLLKTLFKKTSDTLILHARRDHEVLMCLLLRALSPRPTKIIFTWAAIRKKGLFSNFIVKMCDAIIATSNEAASYAPHCFCVITHGVDVKFWSLGKDKVIDKNTLNIAIIGRIREEKGVDVFIKAMSLHKDKKIQCHIVGNCTDQHIDFQNDLKKLTKSLGSENLFTWHGEIKHQDMPQFMKHIDVVIACPRYEGFGLTLFEAALAGCAVIGTRTGAFPMLIGKNERGQLVECNDVNSLSSAIEKWISDPIAMKNSASLAEEHVKQFFSSDVESDKLLEVYIKLSS